MKLSLFQDNKPFSFSFRLSQSGKPFHCLFQLPFFECLIPVAEHSIFGKPKCPKTVHIGFNQWMVQIIQVSQYQWFTGRQQLHVFNRQLDNKSCPIIIKIANAPKTNPAKGMNSIGIVIYQYNNEIATSILLVTILCQSSLDQYTMELHFSLVDCGQTLQSLQLLRMAACFRCNS